MNQLTEYTIRKTDEYDAFKLLGTNRAIDPAHVKTIKSSIKEHGFLINPILINNKMEVIDGQHRLQACKDLSIPTYYINVGNYDIEEVQALNLSQKNWTMIDYAESFASMGYEHYKTLLSFCEEMDEFSFTSCVKLLQGTTSVRNISNKRRQEKYTGEKSGIKQVFEEGTWEVHDVDKAYADAEYLRSIGKYYSGYSRSAFVSTIISLFNKPQFDRDEFMRKLSYQSNALNDCANVGQYLELIEEIYNFKKRDKVNLRF